MGSKLNVLSGSKCLRCLVAIGPKGPPSRAQSPAHLRVGLGWAMGFMGFVEVYS